MLNPRSKVESQLCGNESKVRLTRARIELLKGKEENSIKANRILTSNRESKLR